jgi:hypothetical protein
MSLFVQTSYAHLSQEEVKDFAKFVVANSCEGALYEEAEAFLERFPASPVTNFGFVVSSKLPLPIQAFLKDQNQAGLRWQDYYETHRPHDPTTGEPLTDAAIIARVSMNHSRFSKAMMKTTPTKDFILALAFALRLDVSEANAFLLAAGYAFEKTSPKDMIVFYHLLNRDYALEKVDECLLEENEKPLGTY